MKRFSLVDGELVEDEKGEWAPMSEVRDFALCAARVGADHDKYAKALVEIATIPLSMPLSKAVSCAREALDG